MAQPDTLMSRAACDAIYAAPSRSTGDQLELFAAPSDEAARQAMWDEQVRMLYRGSNASWGTRWISRTLFIFGVLALSTMAFYVFFGESREVLSEGRPIAGQEQSLMTAGPAHLLFARQAGSVNERIPLGIFVQGGNGDETVTLKGFAAGTDLSLGTPLGGDGWILLARDLLRTFVEAPAQFSGIMRVTATAHSPDGLVLDGGTQELEWIARTREPERPSTEASVPPSPIETSISVIPDKSQIGVEQLRALTARGQELLQNGDIVSARLVLERAARAGSALAALELGLSFDPEFLRQLRVVGLVPEVALARQWYERASLLGSSEAKQRLDRLAQTPPK